MKLQHNINRIKSLINVISEQNSSDEFDALITLGITDTGLQAPFTDAPKIAKDTNPININERQPSTYIENPKLRRPWGDPYIYYKANNGNYYAYKCGKEAVDKIKPCPAIKKEEWKDATQYKTAIETLVFTNNNSGGGNSIPTPTPTPTNTLGNESDKIKNEYRKKFYDFFANKILNEGLSTIKQYPSFPYYKLKLETKVFDEMTEEEINLVNPVDAYYKDLLKKSIDDFSNKYKQDTNALTINASKYLLNPYKDNPIPPNQLFGLSEIFKQSGGYVGSSEAMEYSRGKRLAIFKL